MAVPVFQDRQIQNYSQEYDPSSGGWNPTESPTKTYTGWGQALDSLEAQLGAGKPEGYGAYAASQLFQDPNFQREWNQQYPGTLPQVSQHYGFKLNEWRNNESAGPGFWQTAAAIGGGVAGSYLGAGAEAAAYEGGAHLGGGASTMAGAGAVGASAIPASAAGVGAEGIGSSVGGDIAGTGAGTGGISGSGVNVGGGDPTMPTMSGQPTTDLPQGTIPQQQPVNGIDLTTTPQGPISTAPAEAAATTAPSGVSNLPTAPAGDPSAVTVGQPSTGNLGGNLGVDQWGNVTGAAKTATGVAGGAEVWNRIINGTATAGDWASIAGNLAPGVLGYLGATNQADSFHDLATQYMGMGAPYRQRLSDLYADPSSFLHSAEVQGPVQQGTDAVARALSVNGNPAGSGHALQEMQNYASNQLFGRLGQEKDRLAGFGGLSSYNAAAPSANTNAVNATAGQYNAVGYGLSQALNPMPTLDQYFRRAMGGGSFVSPP